jgi:hypothetical protein
MIDEVNTIVMLKVRHCYGHYGGGEIKNVGKKKYQQFLNLQEEQEKRCRIG